MMEVNYVAVIVAAVAAMALGAIWYGPLFGKRWMALSGFDMAKINEMKARGGVGTSYTLNFVGTLFMSYVLWHAVAFAALFFSAQNVSTGLMVAFWSWLGFVAPVTLGAVLWEGKRWGLWVLNNAYYIVSLSIMGAILVSWM